MLFANVKCFPVYYITGNNLAITNHHGIFFFRFTIYVPVKMCTGTWSVLYETVLFLDILDLIFSFNSVPFQTGPRSMLLFLCAFLYGRRVNTFVRAPMHNRKVRKRTKPYLHLPYHRPIQHVSPIKANETLYLCYSFYSIIKSISFTSRLRATSHDQLALNYLAQKGLSQGSP